jgi:hypothetical protein
VVLKVLADRPDEDPSSHPYWKREAELYISGLIRELTGKLVPATVYHIGEYPGESVWLWLEDVVDEYGGEWPLEQYRRPARHLGEFNGVFLAGRDLPAAPWVVERTFDFSRTAGVVALVDHVPDDPIVHRHFPTEDDRDRLFAAWNGRDRFVAAREELPRTFCHFDAFVRNLFATTTDDGTWRTVAIDWDQCGLARVGDDAGALVVLTLMFLDWPVDRTEELERTVLEGYREGLAVAGWDGPEDVVLRGYRLHFVNRWLEWVGNGVRLTIDERLHDWLATITGVPLDTLLDGNRALHRAAFGVIDALELDSPDVSG